MLVNRKKALMVGFWQDFFLKPGLDAHIIRSLLIHQKRPPKFCLYLIYYLIYMCSYIMLSHW